MICLRELPRLRFGLMVSALNADTGFSVEVSEGSSRCHETKAASVYENDSKP